MREASGVASPVSFSDSETSGSGMLVSVVDDSGCAAGVGSGCNSLVRSVS